MSGWHYRPAIKDGALVDAPMSVKVAWNLEEGDTDKKADKEKTGEIEPDESKPDKKSPKGGE